MDIDMWQFTHMFLMAPSLVLYSWDLLSYNNDNLNENLQMECSFFSGNMWAQQWNSIENIVSPYPDKPLLDVTDEMIRQVWINLINMW